MNKKLSLLICLAVLAVCLFGAVACEMHEHDYVEHAADAATCDKAGNELYYTCNGCDKLFDKDKQEIASVPTIEAKGHVYNQHPAVSATCTADGNELYYTCDVCKKIFDKDKNEIDLVPTVTKGEHAYKEVAAKEPTCTEAGNELYYTCEGCNGLFDKDKKPIAEIPVIPAKNHAYHKVEEKAATCEAEGNQEYYTCDNGCGQLFDKDKKEITAIPSIPANGHEYVKHDAVAATCEIDGNEAYFSCENCTKLFDVDKKEIEKIVVIPATGHAFGWEKDEANHTAELKCIHDGCTKSKGTIKTSLAEADRLIVDYDSDGNLTYDLNKFGQGLFAVNVSFDNKTIVFENAQADTMTVGIQQLFAHSAKMGKVSVTISVKMDEGPTIYVDAPITLAKLINNVDDLIAIRPVVIDGRATVTGGVVTEQDGHKIVTRYYYLLTSDLNGKTRTEETSVFGEGITDEGYTSGDAKSGFVGVFDGNSHTIKNFTLNVRGFFGHVGGGTIDNVTFENIVLNNADSAVLGKLMDATVTNVTIKNVETAVKLSDTSGIVAYHEIFGSKIDKLNIDLTDGKAAGHIFARQLTDGTGEWKANDFSDIIVKTNYDLKLSLTATQALTDNISGVSVKFNPFTVAKPAADQTTFYYTGHQLTYNVAENALYTVSGNQQTEIGSYTVTVTLKPYDGLTWEDGTTAEVTFTFEIVEMTDSAAADLAQAFANKVTALNGQLLLPRDKMAVEGLVADYEVLHDKVKALLTDVKTALDGMKAQADKYTQLEVVFNQNGIYGKIDGWDNLWAVIYNPTESTVKVYFEQNNPWAAEGHTDIAPHTWAQIVYSVAFAAHGEIVVYGNGVPINFNDTTGGWKCLVYGTRDEAMAQERLEAFNTAVDAISDPLTANDADAIVTARAAYDALTPYALTLVDADKVTKLVNAEAAIGALVDQAKAQEVIELIEALTDNSSAEDVVAASNAYKALTDKQKTLIDQTLVEKLNAAIEKLGMSQAEADKFAEKVAALNNAEFPRDNDLVYELVVEYESLSDDVKVLLETTKITLDNYRATADEYVRIGAVVSGSAITGVLAGYEEYYFVLYNPGEDTSVNFGGITVDGWVSTTPVVAKGSAWTTVPYDVRLAAVGQEYVNAAVYVYGTGGASLDLTQNGWQYKVYGKETKTRIKEVAISIGDTETEKYGKVKRTSVNEWNVFDAKGTLSAAELATLAENKGKELHFYVFNPSAIDVKLTLTTEPWTDFPPTIVLVANSWTKVVITDKLFTLDGVSTVYLSIAQVEGRANDGWMISDIMYLSSAK
uniref:hypothetical protein n=1 Tax=Candidatus Fimenecus sp. TaxID=3022888 RepID=UPI00402618B1